MTEALNDSPPRLAYAAQVSLLSTRLGITADDPSAVLLEAASLADHLALPDGAVAHELTRSLERSPSPDSFADEDDEVRDLHIMLALAAALRPTLLSPQTPAWSFLSALKPTDRLAIVYQLATSVANDRHDLHGMRVDATVLKTANSQAAWKHERERLSEDIGAWHQRALHMTLKYAPATNVWQRWLTSDGILHKLTTLITTSSDDDAFINETISTLENQRDFNQLVRDTDRKTIGRRRGQDIHAGALTQLFDHAQRTVGFARRHLSLNVSRPTQLTYRTGVLTKLRDNVEHLGPRASEELRALARNADPSLITGAANTAACAIDGFLDFLHTGADHEPNPWDILASGLFPYPSIPVAANGFPACDDQEALDTLITTTPLSLHSSAENRLVAADFATTRRMIDWIEFNDLDHADAIRVVWLTNWDVFSKNCATRSMTREPRSR